MKIIGTGLSGLVGSRIVELLSSKYQFEDISRKTGTDILDSRAVFERLNKSNASIVLHLVAYTDVDKAEEDKAKKERSLAWKVNVDGTKNVLEACEKLNKKIIYISTDMVFPGTKEFPEKYKENDERGPVGWYATTKFEGEKLVEKASVPWMIIRIAYPFRANHEKKEYVRVFKYLLEKGQQIKAVPDHYFTPTFIDDLSLVLKNLIERKAIGKFHATGSEAVSPYTTAIKVAEVFGLNKDLISKLSREEFFKNRAPRAYNLSLNNDKIVKLGVKMHSFTEALGIIKKQI
ncbi:MAG: NAD(P)-dependent oxidoreductase [Candidatus Levyibacteriota bacterium]